jgi:hypothetical protein
VARGGRRAYDEEQRADRRLSAARERESVLSGPAGEVLRLQTLAGNTAVNAMMRSAAIQRDEGAAPADTKEKPKQSGVKVIVEDLGEFAALSYSLPESGTGGGGGGAEKQKVPTKIVVLKEADGLSPKISQAAAEGTPFPSVTIDIGGARLVMKNVYITGYQTSGTPGEKQLESLTFDAEEAKWEWKEPPPSGGGEGGY